jgi:hypothetical protein
MPKQAKKAPAKKVAKKAAPAAKKKAAKPAKATAVAKGKAAPAASKTKASVEDKAAAKRRSQAAAAMKAAIEESPAESTSSAEEEFDPAAFFAASGGKGVFRAHVMRKERVDLNVVVRYRFLKGPLVFNAELLNLSKGGLALKTAEIIKQKTVIRIEIPLPHTSELFAIQAEVVWSDYVPGTKGKDRPIHTGFKFLPMSLAKQSVINTFIQQRRDEIIMSKIGLDKFKDSVPVAGLD